MRMQLRSLARTAFTIVILCFTAGCTSVPHLPPPDRSPDVEAIVVSTNPDPIPGNSGVLTFRVQSSIATAPITQTIPIDFHTQVIGQSTFKDGTFWTPRPPGALRPGQRINIWFNREEPQTIIAIEL